MLKRILVIIALLIGSVTVFAQDNEETDGEILHIGPLLQECVGVAVQDCMIVRFDGEDDLSFFYDQIDGFTYEAGFEYTLLVNISEVENPPADASSLSYELIEVVQQLPAHVTGKVWELQQLYDTEIEIPSRYTLIFNEDSANMQADCNQVQANVSYQPMNIETTISTRAACPEDSLEMDYLDALNSVNIISVENGELLLQTFDGILRFAPPSIEGTTWQVQRVLGLAMMLELDDSVPYTMQFEGERISMTIACNGTGATVEQDGAVFHLDEIETEEELCEDDPLNGIFPPPDFVYSINPNNDNSLVLEDSSGNLFELGLSDG